MVLIRPTSLLIVVAVLLTAVLSAPVTAQVYKWVDEDGIVHYTNLKPAGSRAGMTVLNFPCYASDPKCRGVDWERVRLNRAAFRNEIGDAVAAHGVDEALLRAIIHAESAYRTDAVSPKGAQGLMQLMPATAAMYEVLDPFDAAQNILAGAQHLSELLVEFEGDQDLAAAAYNAGSGAVRKYDGIPPYRETEDYVERVRILARRYGGG